jgi:four helix bundle protein
MGSAGPSGSACAGMDAEDWTIRKKPYDIRERLFEFACITVRVVQFLHTRGPIGRALSYQVLKSGISAGANYEEGDDGSSERDAAAKMKISLRELKETRFRLRVLRATGLLFKEQDPVIAECDELVRIVASIVRNKRSKKGTS